MLDDRGKILYIGKAKNLQKRVSSYFNRPSDTKTQSLVTHIHQIDFTVTTSEVEALILEHNLIKTHKPPYNILLKDGKTYPFIYISTHQTFPRMEIYRGARSKQGQFFGPYPNSSVAKQSVLFLQKIFKIRSCSDTFFSHRSRPCLQYQIKRCTAPCVGIIDSQAYQEDVKSAVAFLEGRSQDVIQSLIIKMDAASADLRYEEAASIRDQIQFLQELVQKQYVQKGFGFADVCVAMIQADQACVTQLFIRQGQVLGHENYIFSKAAWQSPEEILSSFIGQYYLLQKNPDPPAEIIVNLDLPDKASLEEALSSQKIQIVRPVRQEKKQWSLLALANAQAALASHLASQGSIERRHQALAEWLNCPELHRIECFDISHTQGDCTVASAVVFDGQGAVNKDYRRYNIKGITPGDDYAAMTQALTRHYQKRQANESVLPDLILIDGGKGQLSAALKALEELQLTDILVIGVSKGPDRKPGEEQLWFPGEQTCHRLPADSQVLHLIQQIRDEAHRYAIVGHRKQRAKQAKSSILEDIPGVGPKKRQALLKHFGGLQGIMSARVEALQEVPGISLALAQLLYKTFHGDID